jgi:pimeloyl-ACP methyl ester carboxylesterase
MPLAGSIYYHTFKGTDLQTNPVVFIHGAGGSHQVWPLELRRLSSWQTFAPDLPGHGRSPGRGSLSVAGFAHSLLEWMHALNLPPAVLVGHSMGSAIAITLALDHPERVSGLALFGAAPRLSVNPQILADSARPLTSHKAVAALVSYGFSQTSRSDLRQEVEKQMLQARSKVLNSDLQACDAFDATDRLAEISCPVLMVSGEEDRLTPLRHALFMAASIPGARLESVPSAGHFVMLEQPQLTAAILSDFLKEVSPPPS